MKPLFVIDLPALRTRRWFFWLEIGAEFVCFCGFIIVPLVAIYVLGPSASGK